jgi:catechol 2,3-dioxygenase-like lactoylglutathione lyase family enzyme
VSEIKAFQHVGVTVEDLDAASEFFVGLGLEIEGRMFVEGEFLDTVCGIRDSRTEIVMLRPPGGGTGVELATFVRPAMQPGSPTAMATEITDLHGTVERLAEQGYGLVGGIGNYEDTWLMAYVRGPEGIVVSLTERIG